MITVAPDGRCDSAGKSFWFIPGKFGFCPCCLDQPHPNMREGTKLAGLSGEGRSSATTLFVSTALDWMNGKNSGVPKEKRKLLGFTDNRQDAALPAGHFNLKAAVGAEFSFRLRPLQFQVASAWFQMRRSAQGTAFEERLEGSREDF